jgi:hypothetical protein
MLPANRARSTLNSTQKPLPRWLAFGKEFSFFDISGDTAGSRSEVAGHGAFAFA